MRTFGTLRLEEAEGGRFDWRLRCEPHVAIRLRRLFRKVENQFGEITVRHTDEVARDIQWFMERYPLVMDDAAREFMAKEAEVYDARFRDFTSVLTGEVSPRAFEMAVPPRGYQAIAAELALRQRGLLVADDLGLGKTCTAIATLTDPTTRPAIVATLTHLPRQWEKEIAKFAPGLKVHIVKSGTAYDIVAEMKKKARGRKKGVVGEQLELSVDQFPDVIVMNYHKLAGWAEMLAPIARSIIFDECQELRRAGSAKYGAANTLARAARYVLGLSATPIYNYGGEMYNVMEVIKPDCLGEWSEFASEWCGSKYADRDKASVSEPKAFGSYLREQGLMIRRTMEDVGLELPPMIKIPHYVEHDEAALDRIEKDIAELAKRVLNKSSTRFERRDAAGEMDWKLRHATGLAKAPYVADFVDMLLESGSVPKVLLYGWHRDVYDIWLSKLKSHMPAMYTGSESTPQKAESFRRFSEDSRCRVMLMSLRSGAGLDGLQYTACNTLVFGELDWSPMIHDQCGGRLRRFGNTKNITAYYLVSDEGSDPFVSDVLGLKRAQIGGVRDPSGDIIERVDRGDGHIRNMAIEYLRNRGHSVDISEIAAEDIADDEPAQAAV